jgi:hypothetical protein
MRDSDPALCYHRFNTPELYTVGLLEPDFNDSIIPDLTLRYLEIEMTSRRIRRSARDLLLQGRRWEGRQMDWDEITARYSIDFEKPLGQGSFGKVLRVFPF